MALALAEAGVDLECEVRILFNYRIITVELVKSSNNLQPPNFAQLCSLTKVMGLTFNLFLI